jgi:hypothetical protein
MTLFQKFAWVIPVESYVQSYERSKISPKYEYITPSQKKDVISSASNVALCYYLLGNGVEAARFGRETVSAVLEYFYGSWKQRVTTDLKTVDPAWWRMHTAWIGNFRDGLCWASAMRDWDSALRIAEYPATENNAANFGYTRQDKCAYLALAAYIRGQSREESSEENLSLAESGKKQKPKFLAEIVRALNAKDSPRFQQSLEAYLNYFKQREHKKKELDNLLSIDGTIFFHIGKREGLDFQMATEMQEQVISL